jgi:hypothetical protein
MQGEFERARELYAFGRDFYLSAGMDVSAAGVTMHGAWIEQRAGDIAAWERVLRTGYEEMEALGNRAFFSTIAIYLAQCLFVQSRLDEVRGLCAIGREQSPPDDLINFVYADALEGCLLAREDRHEEAEALLRHALERVETTDFFFARSAIRLFHAETRSRSGETADAARSAAEALALLVDKGDLTGVARAREHIADLGIELA